MKLIEGGTEGSGQLLPSADNEGSIGIVGARWSLVRAVTITSGDLNLESESGDAKWTVREEPDQIIAINQNTGKKYRMMMEEIE